MWLLFYYYLLYDKYHSKTHSTRLAGLTHQSCFPPKLQRTSSLAPRHVNLKFTCTIPNQEGITYRDILQIQLLRFIQTYIFSAPLRYQPGLFCAHTHSPHKKHHSGVYFIRVTGKCIDVTNILLKGFLPPSLSRMCFICSKIVMVTSLSKLWVLGLRRKCSVLV